MGGGLPVQKSAESALHAANIKLQIEKYMCSFRKFAFCILQFSFFKITVTDEGRSRE
jgi:hypothetical protein